MTDPDVIVNDKEGNAYHEAQELIDTAEDNGHAFILIAPSKHPSNPNIMGTAIITPIMETDALVIALEEALRHAKAIRNQ